MDQDARGVFLQDRAREVVAFVYDNFFDDIEYDPPSELVTTIHERFPSFTREEISEILQGCYIHG